MKQNQPTENQPTENQPTKVNQQIENMLPCAADAAAARLALCAKDSQEDPVAAALSAAQRDLSQATRLAERAGSDLRVVTPAALAGLAALGAKAGAVRAALAQQENNVSSSISSGLSNSVKDVLGADASALDELARCDRLRQRALAVIAILEQTEALAELRRKRLDAEFAAGDAAAIALHIHTFQEALTAVEQIPNFHEASVSDAQKEVEQLQARLEGLTRPQLIRAFTSHDAAGASDLAQLFVRMNRREQLLDHYFRCVQLPVEGLWNKFQEAPKPHSSSAGAGPVSGAVGSQEGANPLVVWLPSFFDEVVTSVSEELKWGQQVFASAESTATLAPSLVSVIVECMKPLQSSFERRVDSNVVRNMQFYNRAESVSTPLGDLGKILDIVSVFAGTMLDRSLPVAQAESTVTSEVMCKVLVSPLFKFQLAFGDLATAHVQRAFDKGIAFLPFNYFQKQLSHVAAPIKQDNKEIQLQGKGMMDAAVAAIERSIEPFFVLLQELLELCDEFTCGGELQPCLDVVDRFMKQYFSSIRSLLERVRADCGMVHEKETVTSVQVSWEVFQGSLRMLPLAARITQLLDGLDAKAREISDHRTIARRSISDLKLIESSVNFTSSSQLRLLKSLYLSSPDRAQELSELPDAISLSTSRRLSGVVYAIDSLAFDSVFGRIRVLLSSLPKLEAWGRNDSGGSEQANDPLAPQEYATQAGELVLSLPQQLEPFADVETRNLVRLRGSAGGPSVVGPLKKIVEEERNALSQAGMRSDTGHESYVDNAGTQDALPGDIATDDLDEQNSFALQWVSTVCRGMMSLFMSKVVTIASLSDVGARQLLADSEYLSNVVSALGVPIDPALAALQRLLPLSKDALTSTLSGRVDDDAHIASILLQIRSDSS